MNNHHRSTGSIVAQGWVLMFLVLICIFLTEFATSVIQDDLSMFRSREGEEALKAMVLLMLLHAFVPMLVCALNASWFRWTVVGITGVLAVLMLAHEIVHLVTGTKPFGIFHLLDIAHHGLGIWVTLIAIRWAKETQPALARA
jgi:hypothetical protein